MITRPKGTRDIYGIEAKRWKYVDGVIDAIMDKYNYNYIRIPVFEATELFHRGVGEETDIVTKETYDFTDRGERNITLRPEGTAGIVRSYIENKMYGDAVQPVKVYYNCPMYRYERPQAGRYREFTQFGMEFIGSDDPLADAEIISAAYNIYIMLGLKDVTVRLNSLGDSESRDQYRKALVEYFSKHKDKMCEDCKQRLVKNPLRILDCKVDAKTEIMNNAPKIIDYLNEDGKKKFECVKEYLKIMGVNYVIDPKIVRGLDYYDYTVFEIEADVKELGAQSVLGGGGRYNNMIETLGGPQTPAVGFAMGYDRFMLALEKEGIDLPINDEIDCFMIYVNDDEKKIASLLTQNLRLNGFKTETEYMQRNLKGEFKQADRLKSKYLVILNSDDLKNNELRVKNNKTKEEEIISIDALIYYLDEKLTEDDDTCSCGDNCKCKEGKK